MSCYLSIGTLTSQKARGCPMACDRASWPRHARRDDLPAAVVLAGRTPDTASWVELGQVG